MDLESNFSHPLKTCRWAEKEIAKFERSEKAFFKKNPHEEWSYIEIVTGQMVHGVEFTARPSETMEKSVYRAVGDLRNSLDQAVYAAAKSLGVEKPKWTNFPVADTEKEFGRRLATNGQYKDIPVALHPTLEGFEPFWPSQDNPKGDPLLRGLTEMANPNKHHVPLGIECQTGLKVFGAINVVAMGTKWDWKGRTEIYRTIPGVPYQFDMELVPRIAFGQVARLAGKPVASTLRQMLPLVRDIIQGLKVATKRLLN